MSYEVLGGGFLGRDNGEAMDKKNQDEFVHGLI